MTKFSHCAWENICLKESKKEKICLLISDVGGCLVIPCLRREIINAIVQFISEENNNTNRPDLRYVRQSRRLHSWIEDGLLGSGLKHGATDRYEPVLEIDDRYKERDTNIELELQRARDWEAVNDRAKKDDLYLYCASLEGMKPNELLINIMLEGRIRNAMLIPIGDIDDRNKSSNVNQIVINRNHRGIQATGICKGQAGLASKFNLS